MKQTKKQLLQRNLELLQVLELIELTLINGNAIEPNSIVRGMIQTSIGKEINLKIFNMTPKERAEMLFETHYLIQDSIEWTDKETSLKAKNLNDELGSDVLIYWRKLAKQSAIITADYVSCHCKDEFLQEYWREIKHELINL